VIHPSENCLPIRIFIVFAGFELSIALRRALKVLFDSVLCSIY
jgi:hypothetical protein